MAPQLTSESQFRISSLLSRYPELTKFSALVNSSTAFPDALFDQLTNYTLLAPNNDAITAWEANNLAANETDDILKYHLLFGKYPTASIAAAPIPIRTWMSDIRETNVTNGQRVITYSNSSGIYFESGSKIASKVVTPDIVGNNGFVHIIDKVLTIPTIAGVTAGNTQLSYFIELMNQGNYLSNTAFNWDVTTRQNSTFFAPNTALAVSHIPPNGNQSIYDSLLLYHCVSELIYSSDFQDGMMMPTFNGSQLQMRVDGSGQIYVNNAKIIGTNYLNYNGVMHFIDDLLDPNNLTSTASSPQSAIKPSSSKHTNSARLNLGLGIGIPIILILLATGFYFLRRKSRKRKQTRALKSLETESGTTYSLQDLRNPVRLSTPDELLPVWEGEHEPKSLIFDSSEQTKSLWVNQQKARGTFHS